MEICLQLSAHDPRANFAVFYYVDARRLLMSNGYRDIHGMCSHNFHKFLSL